MRNSLLIFIACILSFATGYGVSKLLELQYQVSKDLDSALQSTAIKADSSYNKTVYIIKEVPVEIDPYNYEQENILQSIKSSFFTEAVKLVVDGIPISDLVPLISRISGFKEDSIWLMQRPDNFAKNIIGLHLEECQEYYDPGNEIQDVLFSKKVFNQVINNEDETEAAKINAGTVFSNRFIHKFNSANATRIYANFKLPNNYEYTDILVKWCNAGSNRNIVYGPYSVDFTRKYNYVWYETLSPQEGTYFVNIYSADETPQIIAAASYILVSE